MGNKSARKESGKTDASKSLKEKRLAKADKKAGKPRSEPSRRSRTADAALAALTLETAAPDRRRWLGLVFISIAVSLIIVDSTIVNVAIPSIVDDLGITSTQVQWVQEAYTLVFAALLLVFGSLADQFGRRRMLLIGVAIFALSTVAAALAPTGDLLIPAARRAGRRRRDDPADHALAHQRDLPRPRARHRLRRLGVDDRRHGRGRAAARRLAHHRLLLALGFRDQRAARHPHRHRRAVRGRRVQRDATVPRSTSSAPRSR